MFEILSRARHDEQESWISASDLMAGLMMVFLLISIIYAREADTRTDIESERASYEAARAASANERVVVVTEVVTEWQQLEEEIYQALWNEFNKDLSKWNAEIEKDSLTMRFLAPEILFETGSAELSPEFKVILQDFMPRYILLLEQNFKNDINEVRIEGHTSSEFGQLPLSEAFIKNMALSQARTRTVLEYSFSIEGLVGSENWMRGTMSANGLSSAKLIMNGSREDKERSRRVEFKIRTKTREALRGVLEQVSHG